MAITIGNRNDDEDIKCKIEEYTFHSRYVH